MVFRVLVLGFLGDREEVGLASSRCTVGETKRRSTSAARMAGKRSKPDAPSQHGQVRPRQVWRGRSAGAASQMSETLVNKRPIMLKNNRNHV